MSTATVAKSRAVLTVAEATRRNKEGGSERYP